jgi:hypothetical protein
MWKANGKTTTLQLFLDSLSPKTEKLSLEGTMDLSRDRIIPEPMGHKRKHMETKHVSYLVAADSIVRNRIL